MPDRHRSQSRSRLARLGSLLLLGAACLAGCASGPKADVSGSWQENAPRNDSFARVLIVGVSPDVNQRCRFERFMASKINNESTTTLGIASCSVVTQKTPLTRESIEQAVVAEKADAVLATLLVSREWKEQEGGSRDTRGGGYYKATGMGFDMGYYGLYGVPVVYGEFETAPSAIVMQGEVNLASRFYATQGPTLIYTLNTTARDLESSDSGTSLITAAIAERLHREGLIR